MQEGYTGTLEDVLMGSAALEDVRKQRGRLCGKKAGASVNQNSHLVHLLPEQLVLSNRLAY